MSEESAKREYVMRETWCVKRENHYSLASTDEVSPSLRFVLWDFLTRAQIE